MTCTHKKYLFANLQTKKKKITFDELQPITFFLIAKRERCRNFPVPLGMSTSHIPKGSLIKGMHARFKISHCAPLVFRNWLRLTEQTCRGFPHIRQQKLVSTRGQRSHLCAFRIFEDGSTVVWKRKHGTRILSGWSSLETHVCYVDKQWSCLQWLLQDELDGLTSLFNLAKYVGMTKRCMSWKSIWNLLNIT